MTLLEANIGEEYIISAINTDDEEIKSFLFTLGCYSGSPVVVASKKKKSVVISIKDSKYSIDSFLAEAIEI